MRGATSRGRGSRGRNSFQRTPQNSVQGPPCITCWGCRGPHYQQDYPEFRTGNNRREGKEPMGGAGSHHRIYAAVDNQRVEHQYAMVETSSMINKVKVKTLFNYGATDSFISLVALDKCGLAAYEHNEFKQVDMASGIKQAIGPSVDQCQVNLRVFMTKLKAYVIALGRQGCKLYLVKTVSDQKGPSLDQHPVLVEVKDVLPEELPGLAPIREIDFTIDLKPGAEPISKTPYRMITPNICELQMQLKEL
eukprot:PITA_23915